MSLHRYLASAGKAKSHSSLNHFWQDMPVSFDVFLHSLLSELCKVMESHDIPINRSNGLIYTWQLNTLVLVYRLTCIIKQPYIAKYA